MNGKAWTQAEIRKLEESYEIIGSKCAELLPGRTTRAVIAKANKLRLKCLVLCRQPHSSDWTEEELNILKSKYPNVGILCEQDLPNKTIKAIYQKSFMLKIKAPRRVFRDLKETVKNPYGRLQQTKNKRKKYRELPATKIKIKERLSRLEVRYRNKIRKIALELSVENGTTSDEEFAKLWDGGE